MPEGGAITSARLTMIGSIHHSIDKRDLAALKGATFGALWSAGYCTRLICKIDPQIVQQGPALLEDHLGVRWPTPKASIPLGPDNLVVRCQSSEKKLAEWMGLPPRRKGHWHDDCVTCMAPGHCD